MSKNITALVLGDIVGQPGVRALFAGMDSLKKKYSPNFIIVNGENSADGFGITPELVDQFLELGVDCITTGNHIWQKREIISYLKKDKLLRPANYPPGTPGTGFALVESGGFKLGVMNLMGRLRMATLDDPFRAADRLIEENAENCQAFVIDFHAEEPQEKEALSFHLDGRVAALLGTHTHVQTADEKILSGGTAYITDLGMCGPSGSVIGSDAELAIRRSSTQMPLKLELSENRAILHGVVLEIDPESGKALSIERVKHFSLC